MSTDPWRFMALLCCLLPAAFAVAQEQGQYRSRILLDPLGELGKGSEMSVQELEQQIDSIEDPYARASAGRHLARHHVQQGNYQAAIDYYREALAAAGLAPVANREMLRELAQVYLLQGDYRNAAATLERALAIDLAPEARDYLLLARARHELGDYVGVVDSLDRIAANGLSLDVPQQRQALALYYRAGAWEQSAQLLRSLQAADPGEPSYWHQLASVYLQQGKRRQALDVLVLAREKGVPFTGPETRLLIDLLAATGNPYGAAEALEQAIAAGEIPGEAASWRKLFELWLQARERQRAMAALRRAAALDSDPELHFYLAQLYMEDQQWPDMEQTVLTACAEQLPDRYVSRANLLLGVSLLKQGNSAAARSAFINASLVGGAHEQAAQWLAFMEAAPATEDEMRRVVGPCYGSEGKRAELAELADPVVPAQATDATEAVAQASGAPELVEKRVEPLRLFYVSVDEPGDDVSAALAGQLARLGASLAKAGGSVAGDPMLVQPAEGEEWQLALPVRGNPQARGRYRTRRSEAFYCLVREVPAESGPLGEVMAELAQAAEAAGHSLSGERRLVFSQDSGGEGRRVELQLGLRQAAP